jgi:hypothetical protein
MAKGTMQEFYTNDKEETQSWINALKQSVILLDFKEELQVGKLLGRGNFAKVNLSTRRYGDDQT